MKMTMAMLIARWIGKQFMKYWPVLLVLAAILYLTVTFMGMRGEINSLTYINQNQQLEIAMLELQRNSAINLAAECNAVVAELKRKEIEYLETVEDLMSRPPEVIVKYRDAIVNVEDNVNAETCEETVVQMAAVFSGAVSND